MDYLATQTDLQPLLSGDSPPNCNEDFSERLSPAAADVVPYLVLHPPPPAQVQANEALPIVALLTCDLAQHQNDSIVAFATLLSHTGEELPGKLLGNTIDYGQLVSVTTTKFCFTPAIPDIGNYRFKITLERIRIGNYEDDPSWLHVESEDITVTNNGGFPPSENKWDLFEDVYGQDLNQDSEGTNTEEEHLIVPLPCRKVDDSKYTYDTELFPWKMSMSPPPKVVVGGIAYDRHMVLIPEAEIINNETGLYEDPEQSGENLLDWGEGLFSNREGKWYEIDENEERSLVVTEEDEVLDGDDGRKYRKSIGCLELYYVGLRREVVTIDTVRHIAHLVLLESAKYWGQHDVLSVTLSPDGTRLAEASADNKARIWDTDTGALLLTLEGHYDGVFSVAFSPDGRKVASASYDKTLNIWDTDTGALLLTLEGHSDGVFLFAFSLDGTKIASASYDKALNIWDTDTGALLLTLTLDGVFSVAFSPDGRKVASASYDKTLNIWDTDMGALLMLEGHSDGVFSVAFSPDGRKVASASYYNTLNIWDTDTGAVLLTLGGHPNGVFSVAFSPDGTKIASASYNKTLNIWDTDTGALLQTLEGHTNEVRLLFSPDSKLLALVSHKAMWLWDYTKYATPQTLRDNSGKPVETETVTFSPDGKELISASLGMEMWHWDTITGLLLSTVVVGRHIKGYQL